MIGMTSLAKHILAVGYIDNIPITSLQLQKVMYFTLGLQIRDDGRISEIIDKTYDEPFEKWKFGPVVESIFYKYGRYGEKEIDERGKYIENYSNMDYIITNLLRIDPFSLINLAMKLPSWYEYENKIMNNEYVPPYTIEEIEQDFQIN